LSPGDLWKVRKEYANTNIYRTVYNYQENFEGLKYGPLVIDFDGCNFEDVRQDTLKVVSFFKVVCQINDEDLKIYFSGKKGIHLYVLPEIFCVNPCNNLHKIYRKIIEDICNTVEIQTVDTKVYDSRRLIRLVNSLHGETCLYKAPLTLTELREKSADEIYEIATAPRFLKKNEPKETL